MLHCRATIQPLHPDGSRRTVRVVSANIRELAGYDDWVWEPAMVAAPNFQITLFNGDFKAAVLPGTAIVPLALDVARHTFEWIDVCDWSGAPVEIRAGEAGAPNPWPVVFAGVVSSYETRASTLTLTAESGFDDKDILTATYAGTGDAEGGADIKGKVKPLALGWPQNVEPVPIDQTNSVFQFSAYGPIEAVTVLYERGSAFGASSGDFADYGALVAASLSAGQWGTCLAQGLVRLGAPPAGVITGDIKGHVSGAGTPRLTGAIIAALADLCGIPDDAIETASLDALDIAAPYPVSIVIEEQKSFTDIASDMPLHCNFQAGISLVGTFFVMPIALEGIPKFRLDAAGRSHPQVIQVPVEQNTSAPYWKTKLGAARSWRVHSAEEIAYYAPLLDRGPYNAITVYREGNWVSTSNGATWLYVNSVAAAGNAPPVWPATSNAWWSNRTPPGSSNAAYADGTPIDSLKPSEAAADVTMIVTGPATDTILFDYAGVAKVGQFPKTYPFKLTRASGTDVTTAAAWTATTRQGEATYTIGAATGILNVTGLTTDAIVEVAAVYLGATRKATISLLRSLDAPPQGGGGGGTSASTSSVPNVTGNTYGTSISSTLSVKAGTNGRVDLTYPAVFYEATFNLGYLIYGKWQRDISGTWTDVASEIVAQYGPWDAGEWGAGPGYIEVTMAATGLTSGTTYDFRLTMRNGSAGLTSYLAGTAAAVGS